MRAVVAVRDVADAFPYGSLSRRVDLDHSVPYDPNGPPGQTGPHNLAPLSRPPHRVVTFSKWRRRQPDPGTYLFRSPHGRVWIVTNQGTMSLGRTAYSRAVWDAAAPPPEVSAVARSATRAFAGTSVQFERSIWSREHEGPNTVGAERARPAGN